MDDNMMYEYLLAMGAMRPEQDELKRKQASHQRALAVSRSTISRPRSPPHQTEPNRSDLSRCMGGRQGSRNNAGQAPPVRSVSSSSTASHRARNDAASRKALR